MQLARVQMFNPTSDGSLAHVRCKGILQTWSDSESAQSITGLETTRCQPTSKVGQILLINRKQPKGVLTRNQGNQGP